LCELNTKGPERCPSAQKVVNAKNRKTVAMSEVVYTNSGPKVELEIEEDAIAGTSAALTPAGIGGDDLEDVDEGTASNQIRAPTT
jgi:hypothetical protein